jgi:hypothetical protein
MCFLAILNSGLPDRVQSKRSQRGKSRNGLGSHTLLHGKDTKSFVFLLVFSVIIRDQSNLLGWCIVLFSPPYRKRNERKPGSVLAQVGFEEYHLK